MLSKLLMGIFGGYSLYELKKLANQLGKGAQKVYDTTTTHSHDFDYDLTNYNKDFNTFKQKQDGIFNALLGTIPQENDKKAVQSQLLSLYLSEYEPKDGNIFDAETRSYPIYPEYEFKDKYKEIPYLAKNEKNLQTVLDNGMERFGDQKLSHLPNPEYKLLDISKKRPYLAKNKKNLQAVLDNGMERFGTEITNPAYELQKVLDTIQIQDKKQLDTFNNNKVLFINHSMKYLNEYRKYMATNNNASELGKINKAIFNIMNPNLAMKYFPYKLNKYTQKVMINRENRNGRFEDILDHMSDYS